MLLLSIGTEEAANILRYMRRSEVEAIVADIAKINRIDVDLQDRVLNEFDQIAVAKTPIIAGGADQAKVILQRAFHDQQVGEIMDWLNRRIAQHPFASLHNADVSLITQLVSDEHPQFIAVILSYADASRAATVLATLPATLQIDVVRRIARMGRVSPEVVADVEALVERKVSDLATVEAGGGLHIIVPILNNVERASERQILADLDAQDPELAETIRNRMFVFENVAQLDDRSIQTVLRRVDTKTLALSLKGVAPAVSARFMSNLSTKAAELLQDDIAVLGPARVRDVEQAQREIVGVVRQLEDAGEIVVSRGEQDELIV